MSKNEKPKKEEKAQRMLTGGIEDFITEETKTVEFNIDGKANILNLMGKMLVQEAQEMGDV